MPIFRAMERGVTVHPMARPDESISGYVVFKNGIPIGRVYCVARGESQTWRVEGDSAVDGYESLEAAAQACARTIAQRWNAREREA